MNIFVIFLLLIIILLMLKIKLSVYFKFDNFESCIKIQGKFINIKRKGNLIKRNKKYIIENKRKKQEKNKDLDIKKLKLYLKHIEVENLNINLYSGVISLFPTIYSIPIFSTILEYIKTLPFKKLKNYKYEVIPIYDELKLAIEADGIVKIRLVDLLKFKAGLL